MKGFKTFKGYVRRTDFDAATGSFFERPVKIDEIVETGCNLLKFKPPKGEHKIPVQIRDRKLQRAKTLGNRKFR